MSGELELTVTPPPKLDQSSPFFLGNHDRPGESITDVRLTLSNFDDWAHSINVALRSRRKFGFFDGSINSPIPPATAADLDTVHCMLVSWLMRTISPEVKSLLSNYDNAKRLWDDLNERFNVVNGPRIQQLKSDLNACKQTETMTVAVYFGKLNALWDELDKHEPLISCSCRKCECAVGKQHATRRETDRLHQFLLGLLPIKYRSLRSVLLAQDPLPSLNRAFQTLIQDERVRDMDISAESTVVVSGFAVHPTPNTSRFDPKSVPSLTPYISKAEKRKMVCAHCKKSGHEISMCFDLTGEIPLWWYELKGTKPPSGRHRPGNRGGGGGTPGGAANLVVASSHCQVPSSSSQVTVSATPPHNFMGPTYESGDWHG